MALQQRQYLILGGGALAAYFLLKKPKPGQPPNALQKLLNPSLGAKTTATTIGRPTASGGFAGSGQAGGGAQRPTTTNLATQGGRATTAQTPSLQGFGSNPIQSLIGGFANLAGSILKSVTGRQVASGTVATRPIASQPTSPQSRPPTGSSGGTSSGGGSGSGGSGGAQRPGSSPFADTNIFGGPTNVSSTFSPEDYVGINPDTGLYDPDYDPSVIKAGYWDPVTGDWVQGEAPPVQDYSQLPGYGTALPVVDDNGSLVPEAPALGNDTGTSSYQAVGGGLSGPDDAGYYYYPDGSIAWGYGEAPSTPAEVGVNDDPEVIGTNPDFQDLPGYGTPLPYVTFEGSDVTSGNPPPVDDYSSLPGYGTDIGLVGATVDDSYMAPDDTSWFDDSGG